MARKRAKLVPLVPDSDWIPLKTPCVVPELNREAAEPRIVLIVEPTVGLRGGGELAIRLTADEADQISRDLAEKVAEIRRFTS